MKITDTYHFAKPARAPKKVSYCLESKVYNRLAIRHFSDANTREWCLYILFIDFFLNIVNAFQSL